jgi:immune inhibitor A
MAADALLVASGVVNFARYDNDGDGEVEAFFIVHAGKGAENSGIMSDLWSVQWDVPRNNTVNGVNVNHFLTVPENALLGVCAHEIGHLVFGWPDLYDTDESSSGLSNWCLMASGSWGGNPIGTKPCHPSAWCKATQGWIDVQNHTENGLVSCVDVKTSRFAHRFWTNGEPSSKEYFLCENRQLVGYDASMPGGGLLSEYIFVLGVRWHDLMFIKSGISMTMSRPIQTNSTQRSDSYRLMALTNFSVPRS